MKNTWLLILIIVSLCINPQITIPVSAENPEGGTIDGDSIYWENSWGRLEVYPHTVYGEIQQEQYCNATWKLAATDLDIAFRFNFSLIDAHIYELVGGEWIERTGNFKHTIYGGKQIYYVQEVHFDQYETRRFKWNYDVPFNSSGKWDFLAKLSSETIQYALDNDRYVMLDPWWDSSWSFSNQITINDAYIENDLWEFPVLVEIPSSIGLLADGGDSLRFVSFDNTTKYSHEVESFNGAGTSPVWVKIPDVRSSEDDDNRFFVYYGNDAATDNSTPDVWSNNYSLVYHMDDINDSTAWYNNATFANGSAIIAGKIGNARNLILGDYIVVPSTASINDDLEVQYTMSMFLNIQTTANRRTVNKGGATATRVVSAERKLENGQIVFRNELVAAAQEPDVQTVNVYEATDTWYHVAYSYMAAEALGLKIYVNGSYDSMDSSSGGDQSTIGFVGANMLTPINLQIGHSTMYIDEFRISRINRTNSWINATYNNINKTDFMSVSGIRSSYAGFTVNATTNITDYNATLNAYMNTQDGDYAGAYDLGFWYGTTNSPTATDTNLSYGSFSPPVQWDENTTGDLLDQTTYYAKAWASNGTNFFTSGSTVSFTSLGTPDPPTDGSSEYWRVGQKLNLSWTRGTGSDRDFVIRKNGSYPTNPTDGEQVYNTTEDPYYNLTISEHSYFTIFSYNKTLILYSATGLDIPWGGMALSCYNESSPASGIGFDIEIKNQDGSQVYIHTYAENTHYVDIGEIPTGEQVAFKISNTTGEFRTRIYYFDITTNNYYDLIFFLPFANESELYLLQVIDEIGISISDVKIQIQRYVNSTINYGNVSILYTDGNGYVESYLMIGELYQVILSKTGYITQYSDYFTSDIVFSRTFKLLFSLDNYTGAEIEPDVISFAGYLHRDANTLYLNYSDGLLETIDAQIHIYEFNYSTNTSGHFASYSHTGEDSFQRIVLNINSSNGYTVVLHYNHSTFGHQTRTLIFERLRITPTTEEEFNLLFELNYGTNPFGWSSSILFIIACMVYFEGGQQEVGFYMVALGFIMLFINYGIGFNTVLTTLAGGGIPILHIIVGVMMSWRDSKKATGGLR